MRNQKEKWLRVTKKKGKTQFFQVQRRGWRGGGRVGKRVELERSMKHAACMQRSLSMGCVLASYVRTARHCTHNECIA